MNTAFVSVIPTTARSSFVSSPTTNATTPADMSLPMPATMSLSNNPSGALSHSKRLYSKLLAGAAGTVCAFMLVSQQPAHAALFHFSGTRPTNIGVQYGRYLQNCPASPNCISSSANAYDSHYVPSWTYNSEEAKKPTKTMKEAVDDLVKTLKDYPGVTIVENKESTSEFGTGHYIYAEFESKLMGFVDDVEFYFRPDASTVEYRSASRLGESDMGANRKRIRDLRKTLQEMDSRWASTGY